MDLVILEQLKQDGDETEWRKPFVIASIYEIGIVLAKAWTVEREAKKKLEEI